MSVETTRDIARQILRHRSFSFQEFSQRYADPTASLGFETREARMQDTKNRQNSIEILHEDGDRAANLIDEWNDRQQYLIQKAMDDYRWAIDKGIAKEQARAVLPEGMTVSRLYMNGTVRSWIHYCQLRMGNGTQKEHREIATACWAEVIKYFPSLSETIVIGE
jgi:thymidylate synthase (FAD)